jgi:hypothetical protein
MDRATRIARVYCNECGRSARTFTLCETSRATVAHRTTGDRANRE